MGLGGLAGLGQAHEDTRIFLAAAGNPRSANTEPGGRPLPFCPFRPRKLRGCPPPPPPSICECSGPAGPLLDTRPAETGAWVRSRGDADAAVRTAALCVIAPNWDQPESRLSAVDWGDNLWVFIRRAVTRREKARAPMHRLRGAEFDRVGRSDVKEYKLQSKTRRALSGAEARMMGGLGEPPWEPPGLLGVKWKPHRLCPLGAGSSWDVRDESPSTGMCPVHSTSPWEPLGKHKSYFFLVTDDPLPCTASEVFLLRVISNTQPVL